MTSCMSSMRSNQLSYASATDDIIPYAEGFVKGFLKSFFEIFCSNVQLLVIDHFSGALNEWDIAFLTHILTFRSQCSASRTVFCRTFI